MNGVSGGPSRRTVLELSAAALAAAVLPRARAFAADAAASVTAPSGPRHGLSVFGDLKYPAGFKAFDYVDPAAPKGGRMVFMPPYWLYNQNAQTFNTLNSFVLKGDAPPRMELCFATLMARALDEPDAVYGAAAESIEILDGGNAVRFRLRDGLTFHDGSPLTADDVAFSVTILKEKGHPLIAELTREVMSVTADDPKTVTMRFTGRQTRQLPQSLAQLPIFSKAWYATRDFGAATLEPPLGSGPYKVGRVEAGRVVEYERVADWWGRDLPVHRGAFNFDVIRILFFRDRQVSFEALKKGDVTFREEFVSRTWMTGYDFPAFREGRVKKATLPDQRPAGAQGYFLNMRRAAFADPRTREAIGLCFDFEWTNKTLFYGLYQRTQSFFQNSPMMAEGEPSEAELKLLEPHRAALPKEVFGPAIVAPVSDGSGQDRKLLRRAAALLEAAGWKRQGASLVDANGAPFTIEFLENDGATSRIVQPFIRNLKLIGITAAERIIDPVQYQRRQDTFDFDVVGARYSLSPTPGEEVRTFWTSAAARQDGSYNLAGISDPVVDALVAAMINAPTREDMTVAGRALDRVLRAIRPWVPNWFRATYTIAYWDLFGGPPAPPAYGWPPETLWWFDPARAAAIGRPNG